MSRQRSLEQERAKQAWQDVEQVQRDHSKLGKQYKSLATSAPAGIQANGLGQTLALWRSKAKEQNEHALIFNHLDAWLKQRLGLHNSENTLEWIVRQASTAEYRRATVEAMAYLAWLKRFAEAEFKEKEQKGGGDGS